MLHFVPPSTVCLYYFFTCTSAESQRCDTEGMLMHFPQVRPDTCPFHSDPVVVPLQHCRSTTGRSFSLILSKTHHCRFSCISAEACWESTPCVRAGQLGSQTSAGCWVWRFWRHGPHWCTSACTHLSGNTGWSWCGRDKSWSKEIKKKKRFISLLVYFPFFGKRQLQVIFLFSICALTLSLSYAFHLNCAPLCKPSNGCFSCVCIYLESAVVKEHHEGAVGFEPLQQVESGHVCICHTTQVPTLRKQKGKRHQD